MATGPQDYKPSGQLPMMLATHAPPPATVTRGDHEARLTALLATAQVHTGPLALAAATAVDGLDPDGRAWADVAGTKFSSG